MAIQVKMTSTDNVWTVDETACLVDVERAEPKFFKFPHGKRETYSMYRGFLIVRHTVQLTGRRPERRTVVYLFGKDETGHPATLCVSAGWSPGSIRAAERLIDAILQRGTYTYGDTP